MDSVKLEALRVRTVLPDCASTGRLVIQSAFLAVLYWPNWGLVPSRGLDDSWRTALTWAHELGLQWGPDVVFTYGPLFFLDHPLADWRLGLLVASAAWLIYVGLLTGAVYAATGTTGWFTGLQRQIATFGVTALLLLAPAAFGLMQLHVLVPLALVLTVVAVATRKLWLCWPIGLMIGLLSLHKLSDAAMAGVIVLICLAAAFGKAGLARLVAAGATAFLGGWVVSGQEIANLPAYAAAEWQTLRGYAPAMSVEQPGLLWHYPLAIALGLTVVYCAYRFAAALPRWRRSTFAAGIGLGLWVAAREAFTRHDSHYTYFFAVVLVLCVIFIVVSRNGRAVKAALLAGAVAYLMVATALGSTLAPLDRQASLNTISRVLAVLSSGDYAQVLMAGARTQLAADYEVPTDLAAQLRSRPSSVDPWEINTLFSVNANWRTVPVLQLYTAYTPELDAANVASLVNSPRQILRSLPYPAIDERNPYWESPRYQRLVYCSYRVSLASDKWQLLVPAGTNSCGSVEPALSADVAAGEAVPVPSQSGSMTVVTVTPSRSVLEVFAELLFKARAVHVSYGPSTYRLESSPAAVELMLNGPAPNPAFANLPMTPYPTISLDRPAHLEFMFVPVQVSGA